MDPLSALVDGFRVALDFESGSRVVSAPTAP